MPNAKPCLTLSGPGGVQLSIWKNRRGDSEWFSSKISKRYKRDGSTEWQSTDYLSPRDLLVAASLCQQAAQEIGIRRLGPGLAAPAAASEPATDESAEGTTGETPF